MLSSTTPIQAWQASRARRLTVERAVREAGPRGAMPDILVVETAGYETAREHPAAVVVDRERRCLRRGRLRVDMRGERAFRLLEFVLVRREQDALDRAETLLASGSSKALKDGSNVIAQANRVLAHFGLRVESIWGGSLRLVATERSEA